MRASVSASGHGAQGRAYHWPPPPPRPPRPPPIGHQTSGQARPGPATLSSANSPAPLQFPADPLSWLAQTQAQDYVSEVEGHGARGPSWARLSAL